MKQNTYHTMADLRVVLVDGTVLDTGDPTSVEAFKQSHARLLKGISDLAMRVQVSAYSTSMDSSRLSRPGWVARLARSALHTTRRFALESCANCPRWGLSLIAFCLLFSPGGCWAHGANP